MSGLPVRTPQLTGRSHHRSSVRECGTSPQRGWICVWRVGHLAPDTVRDWVVRALGVRAPEYLLRMRRCTQRSGVRYDLFVRLDAAERVLGLLRAQKRLAGWHVRKHIPYPERSRRPARVEVETPPRVMASWNVNGSRGKRPELGWFLRRERVSILALQETLHHSDDWRLRLGQYQVLSSPMNPGKVGERGVALAIAPNLIAHETGSRSPFWIWARVLHPAFPSGLIVGSVYVIAHKGAERRSMLSKLRDSICAIRRRHVGSPVVIMGDWNMDAASLDALLSSWNVSMARLKCRGSPRTRWRGAGSLRDLDHIVVSAEDQHRLANAWVNRAWDLSDHWPICSFPIRRPKGSSNSHDDQPSNRTRFRRERIRECTSDIVSHNMWEALMEDGDTETEACAQRFLDTSVQVARQANVASDAPPTGHIPRRDHQALSRESKRLIESRRRSFVAWERASSSPEKVALKAEYLERKKEARKQLRADSKARWDSFLGAGAKTLARGEWKKAWRWIKCLGQRNHAGALAPQPVKDPEGNLQVDSEGIAAAWAAHYARLASDATGHSRDPTHWEEKGEELPEIPGLDEPISWSELNQALAAIKGGKAAGVDGLPPEWFKAMVEDPHAASSEPATPMGKAFLRVLQSVWERASIPACWNKAIVVSVPKKGDPTCMDNYRGISLIGIALKLLCMVVIRRIRVALEARGLFVPEQAGFRSREECMGQVIALYEVVTRRRLKGLPTYTAFIDFRKAYDTVPHEALFRKLWCSGIRGRTLTFIKSLYQHSGATIRVGNTLSEPFLLERGLRQGCPMSPILFDIYINDILQGQGEAGVEIPSVDGRRLPGLMFADDVVVLAPDALRLRRLLHRVETWADEWEMSVGASKCGVMVFDHGQAQGSQGQWSLQGQEVPVVDSYTYLGIEVFNDWDLTKSAAAITNRTRKALWSLRPALVNSHVPITVKALMLKALVLPVAALGGELLGMNKARAKSSQTLIDLGLKWILKGDRAGNATGMAALGAELDIAPLHALLSGRRARAWVKFGTLQTWVATLVSSPFRHRKDTWVSGTRKGLKRARVDVAVEAGVSSKTASRLTVKHIWESELAASSARGLEVYKNSNFESTRSFIKLALTRVDLCKGIVWLARMRTAAIWTGPKAAAAKLVPAVWSSKCPSCEKPCKEDFAHILLECSSSAAEREELIQPLVERFADTASALQRTELAVLILGGQVSGVDPSQYWLGEATHINLVGNAPPFLRVAEYLQVVMPRRMGSLWKHWTPRADPSEMGVVVLPRDYPTPNHIVEVVIPPVPDPMSQSPKG